MNQRIAIAIEENGAEERVAEHFGRCSKFIVCELDDEKKIIKTEDIANPLAGQHSGACQLPGHVKNFNVSTIIAGGMGQKAVTNFLGFGINVITAPGLVYSEAIDLYLSGQLQGYEACKHNHDHSHNCN